VDFPAPEGPTSATVWPGSAAKLSPESAASGNALTNNPGLDSTGTLLQGYLESSNVNSVTEITDLIVAQRAYEMNTKVLKASDEMLQSLNQSA
jgi:flagellar basal-body rod protein FlgG